MSSAPPPLPSCATCHTTLDPNGTCPRCRAPEDWNDAIEALDFVVRRLRDWHQRGQITDRQKQSLEDAYDKRRQAMLASGAAHEVFHAGSSFSRRDECWSCKEYLYTQSSHCHSCGAILNDAGVRSLRCWVYLYHELEQLEQAGSLTLRQAHELLADTKERIDALQRKLERERAPFVLPVEVPAPPPKRRRRKTEQEEPVVEETPRRSFLEVLLDPNSIRWLLAAGGALFVIGLVIALLSLGVFENPGVIAVILGVANAVLIGGGWALILRTRFQHAGLALTLLACLVMPLNLWFYHHHKLLTLENHLWVAALVCCIVYVASAIVLRDSLFVYVLVGGITLTGLLLLYQFQHFNEILGPTIFLMVLGLICLHAERAFPVLDSPFSRERFGMAFYWSSQALFAGGLLLLLGAQIVGWLHEPIFKPLFRMQEPPDVATHRFLPWTLMIVLAGTYAYIYSDLVVRKIGVYLYLAAITVLWAEIQVLVLLAPADMEAVIIITLTLTALVINLVSSVLEGQHDVLRVVKPLGLVLSLIGVAFGVILHFRATNVVIHGIFNRIWPFEITWPLVIAMSMMAASCRAGAFLFRHRFKEISIVYFFLTAAATLIAAAEILWKVGMQAWEVEAPFVMVIPILYLIASHFYTGHTAAKPLLWAAHASTIVMLICSLWAAVVGQVAREIQGDNHTLLLAGFCLEAALFYTLAGVLHRSPTSLYMAAVMLCGAVWQFLVYFHTPDELYAVAFSVVGFILIILYRMGIFEKMEVPMLEHAVFQSGNALTTIGFVAGALLSMSRWLMTDAALGALHGDGDWRSPLRVLMYLLILLCAISLASAWLVQHPVWRRVHLVLAIINGILLILIIHRLFTMLHPWQKAEIFALIIGVGLLVIGYIGWYRETERTSDLVSFALFFGSVCLTLPMLIAVGVHRFGLHVHEPRIDDLGLFVACLLLFVSGVMCRILSSTVVGASAFAIYLLIIIIDLHRHLAQQWIVGIYLTLGGALLFGTGLFLSMYREWLLSLPERIRRREGIFRIFDWR